MSSIRSDYERVLDRALNPATSPPTIAAGLTACIDAIYDIDEAKLGALARARTHRSPSAELAREILARITAGHGGALVHPWVDGAQWTRQILGPPARQQAGGNAAQVSWTLGRLGISTMLCLKDRSTEQLSVLDPRVLLATPAGAVPLSSVNPGGTPTKGVHHVLEFHRGTVLAGRPLPRSTRIMVRFGDDSLEQDEHFASWAINSPAPPVTLFSGLTAQPRLNSEDARWAAALADALVRKGAWVHHELSEFPTRESMLAALEFLRVPSLGMSLSELRIAAGTSASPGEAAAALAQAHGFLHVIVHADTWSMAVCRRPSPSIRDALLLGNALAAARAFSGQPAEHPLVDERVSFSDDIPADGPTGRGWRSVAVASPYISAPRGTIGLGDSFCAGFLLGMHIARSSIH